jgi:hypothetical protein
MSLRFPACAVSLSALVLAACAAPPVGEKSAATQTNSVSGAAESELVCTKEYGTGSNIPVTKCRTRGQIDADKEAAAESLRRAQTGGPRPGTN